MALQLSGSLNFSGSISATTVLISNNGGGGIVSSSNQLVELNTATGSIKAEIAGIEAYTASLKGAAIVSSSQQITNYNLFAQTSSANTFYGTQTISGSLNVYGDGLRVNRTTSGEPYTFFVKNDTNRGSIYGNNNIDGLRFFSGDSDLALTIGPSTSVTASGNLLLSNGNLVMGTSGTGIDFSATSNGSGTTTSELLNDYEEGSFTPVIAGGTTAGTATYTDQNGKYTKIGNCVHFRMDVIWSGHTGTGTLKITGLPFTIGQNYQSVGSVRFNQSGSANHYIAGGFIYQTQFELNQIPVGGGVPASFDITSAGDIRVSGHYFV